MKYIILTNNKHVYNEMKHSELVKGSFRDVLVKAKKYVEEGHKLLVSPMPASIRMAYSPVRSLVIGSEVEEDNLYSLDLIENSIKKYDLLLGKRNVDYRNMSDYEFVDKELLNSALKELAR